MRSVVIIGASNVTFALPLIWKCVGRQSNPSRVFAAAGHGRSFGLPNTVMGRTLPSLLECGLWEAMKEQHQSHDELTALVTDVGNDLLYGASVSQIMEWVCECVERCSKAGARIAVTSLPTESLAGLSPSRFRFFRNVLFPRSGLTFEEGISRAQALNEQLAELAADRSLSLVGTEGHWYGADPIHIRRRFRREAWERYLTPLMSQPNVPAARLRDCVSVWRQKAEVRWRGRRRLQCTQPVLTDQQSQLWLF